MKMNLEKKRPLLDGTGLTIGIVQSRWHEEITSALARRVRDACRDSGVADDRIVQITVPGSFELPFGADYLLSEKNVDAVVVLGVIIKGDTLHFESIVDGVTQGVMALNLERKRPVIFGLIPCFSLEQAAERASEDGHDYGYDWGRSAIEMARLRKH